MAVNTTPLNGYFSTNATQNMTEECTAPPPWMLGCEMYEDSDVWYNECYWKRIWLQLPIWVFALCTIFVAVMLVRDAVKSRAISRIRNRRREMYGKQLKHLRVFAACFVACTLTYNGVLIFVQDTGNVDCNALGKFENALYWTALSVIYSVLWMRQRVIFSQRGLQSVMTRAMSFTSFATIVLVFALPAMNILMFSSIVRFCFQSNLRICSIEGFSYAIWVGEFVVPVILPTILLALFAWPLIQHHRKLSRNARGKKSVASILRRIVIATAACLITDIVAITCNGKCYLIVGYVLRQFAIFSNLVSMMASFADWKRVLFPLWVKDNGEDVMDTGSTRSTPATVTSRGSGTRTQV